MNNLNVSDVFSNLVKAIGESLMAIGYKRHGQLLKFLAGSNCGMIGFQRGMASSKDSILFTINLGVVCGALLDASIVPLEKAQITDAHLSTRIGLLLPERQDKWWEINHSTDFQSLSKEILDTVWTKAVPYVSQFVDSKALCSLWESGQSPGLTKLQRDRYLGKLKKILSAGP